jgi:hypothetical protein
MLDLLVGAWWFSALFMVTAIFNTIPGGVSLSWCGAAQNGKRIWQVALWIVNGCSLASMTFTSLGVSRVCY